MFQRILIPTDFSTASEWIFDDAVRIAGSSDAELLILHVRMTWASHPGELRFPADPSLYEYAERLELERLRDRVRRANASVPARLIVRHAPDPGNEICRTAKSENVDLIVIATHARHHVAHLFVGSTTMAVLKDPPCPDEDQARAEALQRELAANVPGAKTAIVRGKDPNDELLGYTKDVDADAIFLNAAAEPSQRKIDLVRHAPVPVMVV